MTTVAPQAAELDSSSDGLGPAGPAALHRTERLYRTIWRWHFYAGLIAAPILITAAVTGGLYVFIDELKPVFYAELMRSSSPAAVRSLDDLAADSLRTYPQAKIEAIAEPEAPGLNAAVVVRLPETSATPGRFTAFVDPADGRVAGLYDEPNSFFGIVLGIHRRLLAGTVGRLAVELAASWGLVLLATGVYLWWPRRAGRARKSWEGVWLPRFHGATNVLLRDWHAVVGFYGCFTAGCVMFTGLFFTQLFSPSFTWITKQVHGTPPTIAAPPRSIVQEGTPRISLTAAHAAAEAQLPGHGPVRVLMPLKPDDTYRVLRTDHADPTWRTTVHVDAYSGRVLAASGWDEAGLLQKVRLTAYPVHVGSIFGLPTKILALLTCAAIVVLSVTGVWMWWRKRPRGTWGVPATVPDLHLPRWLLGGILLLAVLLPAVGGSLVLILTGEAIYRRLARSTA